MPATLMKFSFKHFFGLPSSTRRRVSVLSLYAVIWPVALWICATRLDPDFGWHLVTGRYILAYGAPTHDLYSYTMPTYQWVDHEWLHDVIVNLTYSLGGYTLTAIFFATLWLVAIALAARKHLWFTALLALAALAPYMGVRPILWSALGLVVLERLLESSLRLRYVLIVLLLWAWANLHGSFVLGLGILAATAVLSRPVDLRLRLAAVCAAIATFVNPYGWRIYQEVFRTTFDPGLQRSIAEWAPMGLNVAFWLFAILLVATYWLVEAKRRRWELTIPGGLMVLAVSSARHAVLFVVAGLRYLEGYLGKTLELLPGVYRAWARGLGVAIIAGLIVATVPHTFALETSYYAPSGVAYLEQHPCRGNLVNDYNLGGYVIWKLPGVRTYIDGRMPSWSDQNGRILDRYYRLSADPVFLDDQIATYNLRCALVRRAFETSSIRVKPSGGLAHELETRGWRVVWSDPGTLLIVRD